MSDLVTLTIDGVPVSVPRGTYVVDAAKKIGNDIPVFCYHPKLEPVGMCRMCLVEIGMPVRDRGTGEVVLNPDGSPKLNFGKGLQTGCTVAVSEGMVVRTNTVPVDDAREDIIEFILTSHPLDCPICDKGGECPLQNLTMEHGKGETRMAFSDKMKLEKHVPLGELIYLDRERCIQCGRCTRFQDEIVDDPVIQFHNRGRRLEIVTNSDPGFDSYWSGNTTDICPVGALTTADFRFGARPWELTPVASICPHCPVGCNTTMSTRREAKAGGKNVIKRIMPRQNEAVNEIWICDKGRFVHHFADAPDRVRQPMVRKNGELVPVSWDEALDAVAGRMQMHKASSAGLAGDRLSNEDLFYFQRFFRDGLGNGNIDLGHRRLAGGEIVASVGLTAGSNLLDLGAGDAILVAAADLHEQAPVWWLRVKQAAERGAQLVVINGYETRLTEFATYSAEVEPGELLSFVRQVVTRAHVDTKGEPEDDVAALADSLVEANNLVCFYGYEGLNYHETQTLAELLANLLLLSSGEGEDATPAHVGRVNNGLVPVWPHNNTQGAWDMGVHPAFGPGYEPLAERGMPARVIYQGVADGSLHALFVMGTDPVGDGLMDGRGQLDFLVVQELFMTATAHEADVVLPAQSWAEREGTFTSGERRVQRFYPAIPPAGEARPDWQILAQLGERTGLGKPPFAASLAFRDVAKSVAQYAAMDYRTLGRVEEQWPIIGGDDLYYGGTAYTNTAGLGQQWAATAEAGPVESYDVASEAGASKVETTTLAEGEIMVLPAPALYAPGTLINHTSLLEHRMAYATLIVNPTDALALGLAEMDSVALQAGGGETAVQVTIDEIAPPGVAVLRGGRSLASGSQPFVGSIRQKATVPGTI